MDDKLRPRITASISLSLTTHSYTSLEAPDLNLTVTSHHPDPITIYADDLSPALMLKCGALTITSLTNGCEVKQTASTHCRFIPPTKFSVPLNERLFYTLLPNTPLTLSAPFTRSRPDTGGKPLAKDDPDYTTHCSAKHGACGVDGLEPGKGYVLTLSGHSRVNWEHIRWWEYGTKEQNLRVEGGGSTGLDGRKVRYGRGPHDTIVIDTTGAETVVFHCQD